MSSQTKYQWDLFIYLFILATLRGMWDLSSLTTPPALELWF